jgi:hypothetical protein
MSVTDTALAVSLAIQNGELLSRADELLADEFVYTGAAGLVLDKAGYIGFSHSAASSASTRSGSTGVTERVGSQRRVAGSCAGHVRGAGWA